MNYKVLSRGHLKIFHLLVWLLIVILFLLYTTKPDQVLTGCYYICISLWFQLALCVMMEIQPRLGSWIRIGEEVLELDLIRIRNSPFSFNGFLLLFLLSFLSLEFFYALEKDKINKYTCMFYFWIIKLLIFWNPNWCFWNLCVWSIKWGSNSPGCEALILNFLCAMYEAGE